jgi:hypothetical protein
MKGRVVVLGLGVLLFSLSAQSAGPGELKVKAAMSNGMSPTAHEDRLAILQHERAQIQTDLTAAVAALPNSPDMQEALKGVSRLQADLQAIDREIVRAEAPRTSVVVAAKKTAAPAAGDLSPAPQMAEVKVTDAEYEAWDVFQNFGKKVNK